MKNIDNGSVDQMGGVHVCRDTGRSRDKIHFVAQIVEETCDDDIVYIVEALGVDEDGKLFKVRK